MGRQVLLSDLHMDYWGDPEPRRTALVALLGSRLVREADRLIVNGDVLDLPAEAPEGVLPTHGRVLEALWQLGAEVPITYLVGNHDAEAGKLGTLFGPGLPLQMADSLELDSGGRRVFVRHGHQYDPLLIYHLYDVMDEIRKVTGVDVGLEIEAWYRDLLQRFKAPLSEPERTAAYAGEVPDRGPLVGIPPALDRLWQHAAHMESVKRGAAWVVFGHTHHPEVTPLPNGATYVNSGDWLVHRTVVVIDQGQVQEHEWR